MKLSIVTVLATAVSFGSVGKLAAQTVALSMSCRTTIDARLPGWRLSPPPDDLAAFARQNNFDTNIAQGDFDNDKSRDTALLVVAPNAGQPTQYIAVCLERNQSSRLHLISDPYCGDGIGVSPKGTKVYDYQTSKNVTYRTDAVSAYCFEKAGGSYLFENGRFKLIVDSD